MKNRIFKYNNFNIRPYEIHAMAYDRIAPNSDVLDVGCATGYFAKELQKKGCRVWGVDRDTDALQIAKKYLINGKVVDLNTIKTIPFDKKFDYILLLDVIEHVTNSEQVLKAVMRALKPTGKIILSTPNIANIGIRLSLLNGNFNYLDTGIMDKTHVHFYTKKTLIELMEKMKLKIVDFDFSAYFLHIPIIGYHLFKLPKRIQYEITKLRDTLFAFQFLVVCETHK